jgi:DNA-binding LacI/PurR family transcriptional regulator
VYQLGSTAAELLIKKIEDEEKKLDHKPTVITLNTELIIRNSTKKQILIN